MIGGVGFERHLRKGNSDFFVTTLAEIDKIVDERRKEEQDEELEVICQKLPEQYSLLMFPARQHLIHCRCHEMLITN
jgi:hypothetical protein